MLPRVLEIARAWGGTSEPPAGCRRRWRRRAAILFLAAPDDARAHDADEGLRSCSLEGLIHNVSKYLSKGNPTVTIAKSGAGAVPRSNASSVSASSTPFFQSLLLLLIVVLNDGARPCAIAKATAAARKRGMLPRDVFYGCGGS